MFINVFGFCYLQSKKSKDLHDKIRILVYFNKFKCLKKMTTKKSGVYFCTTNDGN